MNEKEFKTKWIEEIKRSLKSFPKDFISKIPTQKISLPGKTLVSGSEFFGSFEITVWMFHFNTPFVAVFIGS